MRLNYTQLDSITCCNGFNWGLSWSVLLVKKDLRSWIQLCVGLSHKIIIKYIEVYGDNKTTCITCNALYILLHCTLSACTTRWYSNHQKCSLLCLSHSNVQNPSNLFQSRRLFKRQKAVKSRAPPHACDVCCKSSGFWILMQQYWFISLTISLVSFLFSL